MRAHTFSMTLRSSVLRTLTVFTRRVSPTATTSGSSKSLPVFVTMGSGSNVKLGPGGTPIVSKGEFFAFMKDRFDFPLSTMPRGLYSTGRLCLRTLE